MPDKRPPKDSNQLAKYIVDVTAGEAEKIEPPKKNPAAVALASLGAKRGGDARAKSLTKKRRKEIAQKAAKSRWDKKGKG